MGYITRKCNFCNALLKRTKSNYRNYYCNMSCYREKVRNKKKPKTKLCKGCNKVKAFNKKFFGVRTNTKKFKFGLDSRCNECHNKYAKANHKPHRIQLRLDILTAYSNGKLICACCGEKHIEFLTLDHTKGNGNIQRREMSQVRLFTKLRRNKYPNKDEYRVLCMNCNFSYGIRGYCPHQRKGVHE